MLSDRNSLLWQSSQTPVRSATTGSWSRSATDTQFVHLAWQREEKELEKVAYSMGADPTGNVSRLFGVYDPASGLALARDLHHQPQGS